MKLFLSYAGEFLRRYPLIKFSKTEEISIRDSAMKHLGLTNVNQMRDRYEGQAFFDKTWKNIGGLLAIQKHLEMNLSDISKINLGDFQPTIEIQDVVYNINVFPFGELPLIRVEDNDNPVYFIIQKDRLTFQLCGYASREVINQNLISTTTVSSSIDEFMDFTGFKYLNHF